MEGIGLTSTDPAFFDDADLADGIDFGNGCVGASGGRGILTLISIGGCGVPLTARSRRPRRRFPKD
ncbi:hypothetical protein E0H70_25460 [Rhizobium leguminosarum bv. viciae]|nr:hypothetical protein E0H70_25460 [Rhizobium leguminosarum bv. viciae]